MLLNANVGGLLLWVPLVDGGAVAGHCTALHPESEQNAERIHIAFPVADHVNLAAKMSTPGVEPGLSRPRRDVLTTRRCGLLTP